MLAWDWGLNNVALQNAEASKHHTINFVYYLIIRISKPNHAEIELEWGGSVSTNLKQNGSKRVDVRLATTLQRTAHDYVLMALSHPEVYEQNPSTSHCFNFQQ